MCGRYALTSDPDVLASLLGLAERPEFAVRYNVAPSQDAPVVRAEDGGRRWDLLRWGLVPSWAKDPKVGHRMINARSETAADKPSFRAAFKRRRCLVPSSGFIEWKREAGGKQPYLVERADGAPLVMAGLWERWRGNDDDPARATFTILTTSANGALADLHDRMPVVLEPDAFERWLDVAHEDRDALEALLVPADDDVLETRPISKRVNSPKHDDAACLESDSLF